MSVNIQAAADDTVALSLSVNGTGGPQTGLTPTLSVRDGVTSDSYLDFFDFTFKTSGWTTKSANMTEADPGQYVLVGGLGLSAITNLAGKSTLVVEYTVTGPCSGAAQDVISIEGGTLTDLHTKICEVLKCAKNRLEVDFGTQELVLYDDDGTTVCQRWALATEAGEDVNTQFGVQTKRGVPLL